MKFLALALVLLSFCTARAEEPKYCTDLYSETCAPAKPGAEDVRTAGHEDQQKLDQLVAAKRVSMTASFRASLETTGGAALKKSAGSLLGYTKSEECKAFDSETCTGKIADGLYRLVEAKASSRPALKLPQDASMKDLNGVIEDPVFRSAVKGVEQDFRTSISNDADAKKMTDVVIPDLKRRVAKVIDRMPLDPRTKDLMIKKIQKISVRKLCENGGDSGESLFDRSFIGNAQYDTDTNAISVCGSGLAKNLDLNLVFTIAHELGHSIDPCTRQLEAAKLGFKDDKYSRAKMEDAYYNPALLKCLRDSKSIAAKRFDEPAMTLLRKFFGQEKAFCREDQITEGIADWVGTEVTAQVAAEKGLSDAEAVKEFSGVLKASCGRKQGYTDVHSAHQDRVNRLLLQNPKVRGILGCGPSGPSVGYCDGASDHPLIGVPPERPVMAAKPASHSTEVEK